MLLQAASVSRHLLDQLPGKPRWGCVHSVFAHTVNIVCDDAVGCPRDGILVSLHPEGIWRHPYSVTVEGWGDSEGGHVGDKPGAVGGPDRAMDYGSRFLGALAGEPAWVSRSEIGIGKVGLMSGCRLTVSLAEAVIWEGCFAARISLSRQDPGLAVGIVGDEVAALAGRGRTKSLFLAAVMADISARDSRWSSRQGHWQGSGEFVEVLTKEGVGYHLAQMIRRITFDLARAGACGAGELARAAVRRAVGLGWGLTPSGDDFLTGLVAATYMCLGSSGAARRLAAAVEEASDSTSLLARFMLRAACRGRFCEPLAGLVGALARGDRPAAEEWVRAITHVGATSGEDMLAGVLLGLSATEVRGRCYETSAA